MAEEGGVVVLVRHGEAVSRDVDPRRPLSARGRRQAERTGRWAARRGLSVAEVWHSGKARAAETAAIVASHLDPAVSPRKVEGLAPNDDPAVLAGALLRRPAGVMVVGHLPLLAKLAGLLVAGDAGRPAIRFSPGCIAVLEPEEGSWSVTGVMQP